MSAKGWCSALLLGAATTILACTRSPGSVSCGLDALTGPLSVKESFGQGNVLTGVPDVVPASLPVRMVAGPAWRSSIARDGERWRVQTLGLVSKQLRAGYGVLVVDESGAPLGVLVFEGRRVPGAADLGSLVIGDTTVPLLGVRINPPGAREQRLPRLPGFAPMSRPRIAVAGVTREWDGQARVGVNANYVRAVLAAGGLPVIFVPDLSPEETVELFGDCDGLLLTGGEDVHPCHYGAEPHEKLGSVDARRDANELVLVAEARARDLPILGICRGIQLCNVAFGGTLFQDLPSQRPGPINHDSPSPRDVRCHPISVTENSRLAEILGATTLDANSFHHQAVDRVGEGLVISARAPDGVIEGIESVDPHDWVVGVQWHPEELALQPDAADLKLFSALIAAARRG